MNATAKIPHRFPYPAKKPILSRLRNPLAMTICVAGMFNDYAGPVIIAAADTKLSWQIDSVEGALKIRRIGRNWLFCFAATDATLATVIIDDLRITLGDKTSLEDAIQTAKDVYARHVTDEDVWQFMLAGFDEKHLPHLFLLQNKIEYCDLAGFGSVGSGGPLASAFMCSYPYNRNLPLKEAVYCVLAAKFTAERADSIGKETTLTILRPDQTIPAAYAVPVVDPFLIEAIRKEWESLPRIPVGVSDKIDEFLNARKRFLF